MVKKSLHKEYFNAFYTSFYQCFIALKLKQTLEVDDPRYLMALKYNSQKRLCRNLKNKQTWLLTWIHSVESN